VLTIRDDDHNHLDIAHDVCEEGIDDIYWRAMIYREARQVAGFDISWLSDDWRSLIYHTPTLRCTREKLPFWACANNVLMQKAIHAASKIRKSTKQTSSVCSPPSPRKVCVPFWTSIGTIWQYRPHPHQENVLRLAHLAVWPGMAGVEVAVPQLPRRPYTAIFSPSPQYSWHNK
jgi:hypothetical protein